MIGNMPRLGKKEKRLLNAIVAEVPPALDRLFLPVAVKLGEMGACTTMSRMLTEVLGEFGISAEVASVYVATANRAYYDYEAGKIDLEEAKRRGARIQEWGLIDLGQRYQHAVCYIPGWDVVVDLAIERRLSRLVPSHPYWAVRAQKETFPWWVAKFEFKLYYLEYRVYETEPKRVKRGKELIRDIARKYMA